jgi:hypothetical protein
MKKAAAELPQSMEVPRNILPLSEILAKSRCFAERVWAE